jgi:hypothetical protein
VFRIEHRAGKRHGNTDALSRLPCELNCKQCKREKNDYNGNQEFSHVTELRNYSTDNDHDSVLELNLLFDEEKNYEHTSECAVVSPTLKLRIDLPEPKHGSSP